MARRPWREVLAERGHGVDARREGGAGCTARLVPIGAAARLGGLARAVTAAREAGRWLVEGRGGGGASGRALARCGAAWVGVLEYDCFAACSTSRSELASEGREQELAAEDRAALAMPRTSGPLPGTAGRHCSCLYGTQQSLQQPQARLGFLSPARSRLSSSTPSRRPRALTAVFGECYSAMTREEHASKERRARAGSRRGARTSRAGDLLSSLAQLEQGPEHAVQLVAASTPAAPLRRPCPSPARSRAARTPPSRAQTRTSSRSGP